jgi:hypothetical protein
MRAFFDDIKRRSMNLLRTTISKNDEPQDMKNLAENI